MTKLDRRRVLVGGSGLIAAALQAPATAARSPSINLDKPIDNVTAYLKLRASIETQDTYFWFAGGLDMALPGQPITPVIDTETVILRRSERIGKAEWNVTDWEATIYRNPQTGKLVKKIKNPLTGQHVRPIHYREGPVRFRFSKHEPRVLGLDDVAPEKGKPFFYPWRIVDNSLWMTKSSYIHIPHWLQPADYPLASSGEQLTISSISTLEADLDEVTSTEVTAARSRFSYQATTGWLPWMEMGQQPGFVVWHSAGKKLFALDELPAGTLKTLQRVHPQFFERPEPWPDFTNMFIQYQATQQGR